MRKPMSCEMRRVVREEAKTWAWIIVALLIYGGVKWLT